VYDLGSEGFMVYPNPAKEYIKIEIGQELIGVANVVLFDMHGRVVMEEAISEGITSLNVDGMKRGVYLVKITSTTIHKTVKIILE
jgi:hypothetical protein